MAIESLPAAIIGVGGFGSFTLRAMQQSPAIELVGLADRDPQIAAKAGREAGVPAYTDNRSLLAETRPHAVFLAVPPMAAPDLISACAKRGLHVWKELPLARNLGEGVAIVRRMEEAGLKLAVGTQRRFATGYRKAWALRNRLGEIFLGRAHYLFNWGPNLQWRGDKASAGGGAMLELGYHPIDLMLWLLGLPEEVYGISAGGIRPDNTATDEQPLPIYDTDDSAAAILRYATGCMATVVTTRASGPVSEQLSLHGCAGSLTANGERCVLRAPDGNTLDSAIEEADPLAVFRRQIDAFAEAVLAGGDSYECSGRENLLNMAVIDAIYLSDKTSHPESPQRLLHAHRLTHEECLRYRPSDEADAKSKPGRQAPADST